MSSIVPSLKHIVRKGHDKMEIKPESLIMSSIVPSAGLKQLSCTRVMTQDDKHLSFFS